jgi:SSS family solute:Na+ symporter
MTDPDGHPLLDYAMATPNLLLRVLPSGLLGLGLTALLAALMSGIAAGVTAFSAVFTGDLYQAHMRQDADDGHLLKAGRWTAVGGMALSVATAYAAFRFNNLMGALLLIFALVNAPVLATFLLGMFWKRATGHGAFAGLIAGTGAALLHHGLTLCDAARAGLHGGWIGVLHTYPGKLAQAFWTVVFALCANLLVTVTVSVCTEARPETELAGLVHWLTPRPEWARVAWWKRPETLAVGILLAALLVLVAIPA